MSDMPEVAVANGMLLVRWSADEPWTRVRRLRPGGPVRIDGEREELPLDATRLVNLSWHLHGVRVGDIYPVGGIAGDCPVRWPVIEGIEESWWCCTLPSGHDRGPLPLPHVAASYSRVDAVLSLEEEAERQQAERRSRLRAV